MKTILKSILVIGAMVFSTQNLNAQQAGSKPRAAAQPQGVERTRRFLINYLNSMDTCDTWEE